MSDTSINMRLLMQLERANTIVTHAEEEFARGSPISDGYQPFASGGATSRLEALQALYLVVADYFRLASTRQSGREDAMREFNNYAKGSGGIALRILGGNITEPEELRNCNGLGNSETIDSLVKHLKTLDPSSASFWPTVYERIGMPFPVDSQSTDHQDKQPTRKTTPRWMFWKK